MIVWRALLRLDALVGWLVDWFFRLLFGSPIDSPGIRRFFLIAVEWAIVSSVVEFFVDYPDFIDSIVMGGVFLVGLVLGLRRPPVLAGMTLRRSTIVWLALSLAGLWISDLGPQRYDRYDPYNLSMSLFIVGLIGAVATSAEAGDSPRSIGVRQALLPFALLFALLPVAYTIDGWLYGRDGEESDWLVVAFAVYGVGILIYFAVGLPRWNAWRTRRSPLSS